MSDSNTREFYNSLDKKLISFRNRSPLFYKYSYSPNKDFLFITFPNLDFTTLSFDVRPESDSINELIGHIHSVLLEYYPKLKCSQGQFVIDKVDSRSNIFVIRRFPEESEWLARYKMTKPVVLLLKELQNPCLSNEERESIFRKNIKELCSKEDYRVL